MSVSAIIILDGGGHTICARDYRGDVPMSSAENFYPTLSELEETSKASPILQSDGVTYIWIKHADVYLVAVTKSNANAANTLCFLHKLVSVFQFYFKKVAEESIRDNFVVVYELLDEVMDYGYPQFTEGPILREYIKTEAHKLEDTIGQFLAGQRTGAQVTPPSQVTGVGATWRKEGIFYKKNEVRHTTTLLLRWRGPCLCNFATPPHARPL